MEDEPVAILVSGLPRSFQDNLYAFLKQLPSNYHLFISFARSDTPDHFLNDTTSFDYLLENPAVKLVMIDADIPQIPQLQLQLQLQLSEREKNVIIHWYRLMKLFKNVPTSYKRIFRCRPDIKFSITPTQFVNQLSAHQSEDTIYIPTGFDIFNEEYMSPTCVNDQVAYGDQTAMRTYCEIYNHLIINSPIISEQQLGDYLTRHQIKIVRTDLPYKLVLSKCYTIAVCGDSGAGKSTLSKLIQSVLPYDQSLLFETDRYHKWERGAEEYNSITHLNPCANHLEKFSSDTFKLSLGEDIYAVDYDHKTGKFTDPQYIKPSKFMLFCGLHTLYKESLNDIYNLKIYLDTDNYIKQQWKIQRDVIERGVDQDTLLATMKKREPDYEAYIKPQQEAADVIIHLHAKNEDIANITVDATIKQPFISTINNKLLPFLREPPTHLPNNAMLYKFCEHATAQELNSHIITHGCNLKITKDNYEGIIKYLLISLLWK